MKKQFALVSLALTLGLVGLVLLFYRPAPPAPAVPQPTPTVSATALPPTATTLPIPQGTPPPPEPTPSVPPTGVIDGLEVGKWYITPERKTYQDGALTLSLPAINISRTVVNGTDAAALNRGVGLYEYAQLPGEGNRNVSLAGHRNGLDRSGKVNDHAPFYYVDQLGEGDYLYLYDGVSIYRYLYQSTWVVEADDWDPIATTGESCLTRTSCTPIGVSDHRIVVRGILDEVFPYSKDFDFLAHSI